MTLRIIILSLIVVSLLSAQETFDSTPSGGMIGISVGRIPETELTARTGTYESRWGSIHASVPVHRSITLGEGDGTFQQFTLTGSLRRNTTYFTLLSGERVISSGWLGGSWTSIGSSKNLYRLSASIGYTGETDPGGSKTVRLRFLGLGTVHLSDPLLMIYGASFSALFGRDLLMPIVGLRWKINEEWSSSILLPMALNVRYRAGSSVTFALSVSASGDRVQTANRGDFPGAAGSLLWRITGIRSLLRTHIALADAFGLTVDLGAVSKRNLSLVSGSDVILKEQLDASRYVSLGLQYRFDPDEHTSYTVE
ncbi:MAG: hypothetical protein ACOYNS_08435 [Bacteroidota bacterium]